VRASTSRKRNMTMKMNRRIRRSRQPISIRFEALGDDKYLLRVTPPIPGEKTYEMRWDSPSPHFSFR
jgi:hypothetical protein